MFFLLISLSTFYFVTGHGRLRIPPQRSSLWREGLSSMVNTDDNELNCGGFAVHHSKLNGKCGVCGDRYDGVQDHQPPGKYAQGVISRCYKPGTNWIDVKIELTANHLGYIQFKLCPNNNVHRPVTQECLDQNALNIRDLNNVNHGVKYNILWDMKTLYLKVQLPDDLQCSQCVLQWTYTTGNNWGCIDRFCGLGYGAQETFVNCADIAVSDNCPNYNTVEPDFGDQIEEDNTTNRNSNLNCVAVGVWAKEKNDIISQWCQTNCHYVCPPDYCYCS